MKPKQRHFPTLSMHASLLLFVLELSLPLGLYVALNSEKLILAKLLFSLLAAGMLVIFILPENTKS
jgi:hypothetical protein